MKQILNFLWWFSTPFILTFFLLLIFVENVPGFNILAYLRLNIFLVGFPILVYWTSGIYYNKDFHKREQLSIAVMVLAMIYSFIFEIRQFDTWLIIIYILYFLSVLQSLLISYTKYNQYLHLIGSFLVILFLSMIFLQRDFFYLIIIALVYSGTLMFLFSKNELDKNKNMFISYLTGFFSTLFYIGLIFGLDKLHLFSIS